MLQEIRFTQINLITCICFVCAESMKPSAQDENKIFKNFKRHIKIGHARPNISKDLERKH